MSSNENPEVSPDPALAGGTSSRGRLWERAFWAATAERAIRTLAQSALATLVADATGLLDTDWVSVGSVAVMAAVLSVLMSVGASHGPSYGTEVLRR